ncbi:MAG: N-acetylmuramoyl-L-alanine amidase [Acidobacteria bacterium]|nr:N-acetylmuramoyl-L-alanine amidase [Acidobacteriota bacterium]
MQHICLSRISRSTAARVLLFTVALISPRAVSGADTRTLQEKLSQARTYYDDAEKQRADLQDIPTTQRTAKDYLKVIRTYRLVYLTAPSSALNPKSIMAMGDLYQGMAFNLRNPKYFGLAVKAYDFLLQEYPYSRYQEDALLAIAQIYQSDLKQPNEARKRFETYLQKFPKSPRAMRARQALAQMDADSLASGTVPRAESQPPQRTPKPPEVAAVAPKQVSLTPSEIRAARSGPLVFVSNIREWEMQGATRIVIYVDGEVKYELGQVPNPPRIYLDLYGTQISGELTRAVRQTPPVSALVKGLRAAQYQTDVTRVVAEVAPQTDYSVFDLPNPYRLVLEIHKSRKSQTASVAVSKNVIAEPPKVTPAVASADTVAQTVAIDMTQVAATSRDTAPAATIAQPTPEGNLVSDVSSGTAPPMVPIGGTLPSAVKKEIRPAEAVGGNIRAALPNRNGTRSLTRALGLKIGRIILDPGHGGHDTGTIGPTGLSEKELVLDVALRLGKLLSDRLGSEVIFTREDDTFIPLETRTVIANDKQADLFLSIHANSSPNRSARGIETYYLSFATDPAALEIAARENAVSQESVHELQNIVKKIALHEKVDESKEFATEVQSALHDQLVKGNRLRKDRGVKKAPFMVLIGAKMPSVLAEIAFLSNPQEEKLLKTKQQRQKIAEALYAGVAKYAETLSGVKVARAGGPSSEVAKELPK